MAEYLIQDTTLDGIADAINTKTGGSSAMTPTEMAAAIAAIPSGSGVIQSASGEITLDSDTDYFTVSGLSFTPNAFLVYGSAPKGRTSGAMKFCGFFEEWINVYGSTNEINTRNKTFRFSDLPSSLFNYDALPNSAYYSITDDGFSVRGADSSYRFASDIPYYWKAWRFE